MNHIELNKQGEQLLELKQYEEALFKFNKASIEDEQCEYKLNKARALIGLERYNEAIDLLNYILLYFPFRENYNFYHGIALRHVKKYPESIAAFQKEIKNGYNISGNQIEIGRVHFLLGDYQQSLNWLNEGISNSPQNLLNQTEGKLIKASCLYEMEKYHDSLKILDELVLIAPNNELIFVQYGQTYMKMQQFQKAYLHFMKSIKIKPKNSTKLLLIDALVQLKRYEEVIQMCLEIQKDNPSDSSLYTNYCIGLYFQNRFSDSLFVAEKAIVLDPKNLKAYNLKSESLYRLNRFDEALEVILQAIKTDPNYQLSYINQIQTLIALKRFNEALDVSNYVLKNDSNSASALKFKCQVLVELNRSEEALDLCNQTVLFNGKHFVAFSLKGDLLFRQKKFQEAIEAFDSSIKINPNIAETYTGKGSALIQLKKYQEVIEACNKALGINNRCLDALKNKGNAYYFLTSYLNSKTVFLKILEFSPNEVDVLNSIALICRKQNQLMEALDYLNKAIIIDSNFVRAIVTKAEIQRQLKQSLASRSEFEKVIQLINSEKSNGLTSSCLAQIKILIRLLDELKVIVSGLRKINTNVLKDEQQIELKDNITALETALNDFWFSKAIAYSDEIVNESPENLEKSKFVESFNAMKQSLSDFVRDFQKKVNDFDRINESLRKKRKEVLDELEESQKDINFSNQQKEGVPQQQQQQYPIINDTEIVRLGLMKIEQKERVILDYCKTFFWTSVSLITAYRLIKQNTRRTDPDFDEKDFLGKNELLLSERVLQCIRSLSDQNVKNEEIILLRCNPLSSATFLCIDEIINKILSMRQKVNEPIKIMEDKLRLNEQVIQSKMSSDRELATALANLTIELVFIKEDALLYPLKSKRNEDFIERKIEQVKELVLKSIDIQNQTSKAINEAIRDSVQVIVLFGIYGEQIAEIKQPIHQQILKLLSSNKVEEFIASHASKQKKGCDCSIF